MLGVVSFFTILIIYMIINVYLIREDWKSSFKYYGDNLKFENFALTRFKGIHTILGNLEEKDTKIFV